MRDRYDFIIVGAGSSGCVLASRLSEDPARSVLLVESGPPDRHPFLVMPGGIGKLAAQPGNPHYWTFEVSQGGNRPNETWLKGRTLGGSSSVNGMVYVRGAPEDYDGWARAGCSGWGWDEMGRCFAELENHQLGSAQWRGERGPVRISISPRDQLGDAVIAAAREAGTPTVADLNDIDSVTQGGFGRQPLTVWRGRRVSAASAFLRPIRNRRNLDIVTGTEVLGVDFDGLVATGVELANGGLSKVIHANQEVILCAGAINSPKLLQLAGIGPAKLLLDYGIPVRVDSPDVGRNLREHRTIPVSYRVHRGGRNRWLTGPGLIGSALRYYLRRNGWLASGAFDVGGFIKTDPSYLRPDCQIGVGLFTFGEKGIESRPGITFFGYFMRPESQGHVAIRSADPRDNPFVDANYLSTPTDRQRTVALYRYMRKIAEQPALSDYIAKETSPGANCQEDDELIEASFKYGTTGFHVAGTCRMGADAQAVLDPELRVRGVQRLRVVDTSIMPELVSGNTNAPAMAIAWRAAELITGQR